MAGRIPQPFIDDLLARTDIVELIGSRIELKKAGREWKACCPFHGEKTPSFWVSPEKQFYHCFGCGAHGNALGFLMNYDKLSFPEAIEELANRLGLEVPRESEAHGDRTGSTQPLFDINRRATQFFASVLTNDARARAYVEKRGLTADTVERFALGFAPNSWNELTKRLGTSAEGRRALQEAGLIIERDRADTHTLDRHYDRFRDRLMFPIRDARGRVLAFGGRIIGEGEPKYLNSPETAIFHKGRELYGLYECRQSREPLKRLLVVEGYVDVARLHQAGVRYAVATLGTATTAEHLRRAFKLVSEVVFCFDGDRAGRAAAWRALGNALPEARDGRQIKFLFLPEGQDPDSLIGIEGRAAFEARLADALGLSEYLVVALKEQVDLADADGRARFAELAKPLVARVVPGVFRELLLARLGEEIGLSGQRLDQLWFNTAKTDASSRPSDTQSGRSHALPDRRAAPKSGLSAGRGGLIRQAAKIVVHFPAAVTALSPTVLAKLESNTEPGVPLLLRMLRDLTLQPVRTTGQFLERWRGRPEAERLTRLALEETVTPDERAAAHELAQALERIARWPLEKRRDNLIEKSSRERLSPAELEDLQSLERELRTGLGGEANGLPGR